MRLVITSQGATLDSPVDPRFGRARYFLFLDTESGDEAAHDNAQNLSAPQGAGIQAAQTVARLGAQAVLTGHVGPKAFSTLKAAGVSVVTGAGGTVREAVQQYQAGKLQAVEKADVQGHWT